MHFSLLCFFVCFYYFKIFLNLAAYIRVSSSVANGPATEGHQRRNLPLISLWCLTALQSFFFFFCQPFCSKACRLGKQHYLWPGIGQKIRAESCYRLSQSCSDVPKPSWETSYWCNLHSTSEIPSRKEGITEARRAMVIVSEPAANLRRLNWWMAQRVCSTFFLTFLLKSSPQPHLPRAQDLLLR